MRPRKQSNRGLPPNLYPDPRGRATYYRYKSPKDGKWHPMGRDKLAAIQAAKELNARLAITPDLVVRVMGGEGTLGEWLDKYLEKQEQADLAKETLKAYRHVVTRVKKKLGNVAIAALTQGHLSDLFEETPPAMAKQIRQYLKTVLKHAVAAGLIKENVADKTLPISAKRKRGRLTLTQFRAIYQKAGPLLQNGMMLGLLTLQRREDLAKLRFKDIEGDYEYLYVVQKKTEKHGESARLKITIGPVLREVLKRCRDGVVSQYVLHHSKDYGIAKPGSRVGIDWLTIAFANARDLLPEFSNMPPEQRPTFHEIRALGGHLYKQAGVDPQVLFGHTDKAMTERYLEGHKGPGWTETEANLSVKL